MTSRNIDGATGPARPTVAIVEALPAGADGRLPNHGVQALRAARRLGLRTVVLTADHRPALPSALADAWIHCDTASADHVAEALAPVAPTVVFSWVDPYVTIANRAALLLGCTRTANPGSPVTLADKAAVRARLERVGLANPGWSVLDATSPPPWRIPPFPLVAKPVDGFSGIDTQRITSDTQLRAIVRRHRDRPCYGRGFVPSHRLLCEQELVGPLVSAEGTVVDGHLSVWGFTDRTLGPPPCFVETSGAFAADEPHPGLVPYVRKVLEALDYRTGPFHLEIIVTEDGPVLVELNPRLAGAGIHQAIDLTTASSCAEAVLHGYLGESAALPSPRGAACLTHLVAPRSGTLRKIAGIPAARAVPGVRGIVQKIPDGTAVQLTGSNADRLGYVLTTGTTRARCRQTATAALARLTPIIE
ncbi:ATP-grasp domain-containing protein [Actinomadura opuntiae]|uniref:ATP-grasp domain-containing protein n=1 Tax=Actinomadura sp. OS1-43 TaxID=604315 RepID=UPI00255AB02F|nr:ATP-grasp domain-containing protein [Actinomadura sp. OS1-43]MDL4816548.1 ATP-grasp domain-containing protein [Actinomadura sp. OS1-43]